jgi:prolipoprotein diacylglyceryltransferase
MAPTGDMILGRRVIRRSSMRRARGLLLFAILWVMFWKTDARYQPERWSARSSFLRLFRFAVEFVREPDAQLAGLPRRADCTWGNGSRCR